MKCKSVANLPATPVLTENDSTLFIQNNEAVAVALDILRKAIFDNHTYWESLFYMASEYVYLDSICTNGKEEAIYRFAVQNPLKSIVGTDTMYGVKVAGAERLLLVDPFTGVLWTYEKGGLELVPAVGDYKEISTKGAEITLTFDQVEALDKMFELAAYKDEAVAEVYKGFVSAFGLDKYRIMRTLESGDLISAGLSQYFNPYTYRTDWRQGGATIGEDGVPLADGIPYTYENASDSQDRTVYPYYDIPAEGGYEYQIYFEANEGVQVALEFYNQNVLDVVANSGNWDKADFKDGYGWQDSMEVNPDWSWVPPTEINGSPVKAMRLNFNSGDAGIKKVIIYRKKVTEDADS